MSQPWARDAWAGAVASGGSVVGGYPVPGVQDVFYWTAQNASGPWAAGAWGGALYTERASGGIIARAAAEAGTVSITAWWSYATSLIVTRIDADGTRVPVRDSSGVPSAATRRNNASNPRFRDGTAQVSAASGTLSWLSDQTGIPAEGVSTAARVTANASGQAGLRFDGDTVPSYATTMGMLIRTSVAAASLALVTDWYDLASNLVATTTVSPASIAAAQANGAYSWCEFDLGVAPQAAQYGRSRVAATGLGAGGTLDVTTRLWQDGDTLDGPYFDGDTFGGSWRGTPGVSSSTLAAPVMLTDAEAPLDVPFTYEVRNPVAPGYAALSQPLTLPSTPPRGQWGSIRTGLLTHPGLAATMRVWVWGEPETITNPLEQAAFKIKGRRRKVVVSDTQRGGDEGTITFVAEDFAERERLKAFLDDGSPLLLRFPASYGHPPLWWLSFGDALWKTTNNRAAHPLRTLEVPFTEVDRPDAATRPLVA